MATDFQGEGGDRADNELDFAPWRGSKKEHPGEARQHGYHKKL
jgi:hypothetical protein